MLGPMYYAQFSDVYTCSPLLCLSLSPFPPGVTDSCSVRPSPPLHSLLHASSATFLGSELGPLLRHKRITIGLYSSVEIWLTFGEVFYRCGGP